jgi:hypothetical protein
LISETLKDSKSDKSFLKSKTGIYSILVKADQRSQAIIGVFDQRAKDNTHVPFETRELKHGEQISDTIASGFDNKFYKIDTSQFQDLESVYVSLVPTTNQKFLLKATKYGEDSSAEKSSWDNHLLIEKGDLLFEKGATYKLTVQAIPSGGGSEVTDLVEEA